MNVVYANFDPAWRSEIAICIKGRGVLWTEQELVILGCHQSFAKAICRSIMRKEGW